MKNSFVPIIVVLVILSSIFSCSEFPERTNLSLQFELSTDSISFDTLNSTFGTTTQKFRIINPNNESIELENIFLGSGSSTYFRLNVDGVPCQSVKGLELKGNDSIFVFVEATFPDFNLDSVCFQLDSVVITCSSSIQSVKLLSWTQDVILKTGAISSGEVWNSKKPYLVLDSIEIPFNEILTIKEGVKVLFHESAFMKVLGKLKVEGTVDRPVYFQGDRFEQTADGKDYEHEPGQWSGLQFYPFSQESEINYAIIKNAIYGIMVLGSIDSNELPKLKITNSIIKNHSYAGIVSFGAEIDCSNSFFSNSEVCLLLYVNGKYNFNHITVNNNYGYKVRSLGAVHISNYFQWDSIQINGEFEALNFSNSIIYGNIENELSFGFYEGSSFQVNLDHCLLKMKDENMNPTILGTKLILNEEPLLVNFGTHNLMYPDTLSPFIDKGKMDVAEQFPFDLEGNIRLADGLPDLGALEFQK
jgi:hypothetical protein